MAQKLSLGQTDTTAIRAAMFGSTADGIRVVRQAWRVTPTDSDELALLCVRDGSWWVARRLSGDLSVWAYAGDDEAADGFEYLMDQGSAEAPWTESSRPLVG